MSVDDDPDSTLRVLHLAGSPESEFFYDLSLLYAEEVVSPPRVEAIFATVNPVGEWTIGSAFREATFRGALVDFLNGLPEVDIVVNHLFCPTGVTAYRYFFEAIVDLPVVGSQGRSQVIAADKGLTKAILKDAGVLVAPGVTIAEGEAVSIDFPLIVKPACEDNSKGLSLVRGSSEMEAALAEGFRHGSPLIVEAFIPGREIRTCLIEREGGAFFIPPMIEYHVDEENPIREVRDKLDVSQDDGKPTGQASAAAVGWSCPAELTPELEERLRQATMAAHRALGCRDFSLFDFRVHEETGEVYLLEAGLFWAFGRISMISRMLDAAGVSLEEEVRALWQRAALRERSCP